MDTSFSERRSQDRISAVVPVRLSSDGQAWWGQCINYSEEGALVKLEAVWSGAQEVGFELDPRLGAGAVPVRARVVRATSPDNRRAFLALQFLPPSDRI